MPAMAMPSALQVRRALPGLALALTAAALIALVTVDRPLGRFYSDHGVEARAGWLRVLHWLDRATGSELHWRWTASAALAGLGVLAFAVTRWRGAARVWWYAAAVHVLALRATDQLKPLAGRLRPSQWVHVGGDMFGRGGESFPSGYAAYYFGLVVPFAVAWPRIGVPLLVVPCFVAWSRVAVDAHFVSDVLGSALLVTILAWALAYPFRIDGRARWRR